VEARLGDEGAVSKANAVETVRLISTNKVIINIMTRCGAGNEWLKDLVCIMFLKKRCL